MQQDSLPLFPQRDVFTPSRLAHAAQQQLDSRFGKIWIEGEISGLRQPGSGHWYFALKDERAQVRCAFFRQRAREAPFRPEEGQQVLMQARVGLYQPRGEFQLVVEYMEAQGAGLLRQRLETLKRKLNDEGLFDPTRKRPLPRFPRRIAVITSATGAAVRDVISVLQRRFPALHLTILPSLVQGEAAPAQLLQRLATAQQLPVDVVLMTRGGGSLEDLWAFNDEALARAIAEHRHPVVTAIGHKTDTTIADLVADVDAPTPSAAAEMMVPDCEELMQTLDRFNHRFQRRIQLLLRQQGERCSTLQRRHANAHPRRRLEQIAQRLERSQHALRLAWNHHASRAEHRLGLLRSSLRRYQPQAQMATSRQHLDHLFGRLGRAMADYLDRRKLYLAGATRSLDTVNPLAVLERGYSVTLDEAKQEIISRADQVQPGTLIRTRLNQGSLLSRVIDDSSDP